MNRQRLLCADCKAPCLMKEINDPEAVKIVEEKKTTLVCSKNQKIFHEDMPVNSISFIHSGIIKVYKTGINGKNHIIRFSKTGDILGHRGLNTKYYPVSASTIEDSSICLFPKDFFITFLENNSRVAFKLLLFFSKELENSEIMQFNLAQMNVREKVAETLLYLNTTFGTDKNNRLNITLSRQDLSDYAGTTKEQVSKILSEFQSENLILLDKKDIIINELNELKKIASFGVHLS
ncbi:MAG: Crp/Fnr family transcriptional regulator [Bacteroidetes bacterium]|nr:Crp/Fnr family transcriptional regulator [Bacteroidota bacterium]MCL4815747.1 Crp/Fnr family transcriptional regulator [Flavobacteriales bacterium]NOG95805.1 Crp/Fnr family transcriptional regulator [Bacteroidota bacterium]WKZ74753.1 MAG: Crp/Fnr family transcriptional regulator [Vicingaceae bacterium]CAG0979633.1 Transcriptional activator protein Anr [Flavobacteriales bacterium]